MNRNVLFDLCRSSPETAKYVCMGDPSVSLVQCVQLGLGRLVVY